ncbi:MAG: uroporphyrinogen-III synthase [Bacteroidaceae bacterium]|nr:uroporphyrinogen-III synthase [Bacteroidaceae bacterium]
MGIKKILISQPAPSTGKSPYLDLGEKYGFKVVFRSFIKVESISAKEFRAQKVSILDHSAVIFTSRHAIDHFFQLCQEMRVVLPETMKYFCISEQVANYIQTYIQYRKRKMFFSENGQISGLMEKILKHSSETFFIPISSVHTTELKSQLDSHNIKHSEAIMYRTVSNDFEPKEMDGYDMMVFFSPAGIESLLKNYPDFKQNNIVIGCFGPVTAQAVKDAGLKLDIEAPAPGITSMAAAIDQYMASHK